MGTCSMASLGGSPVMVCSVGISLMMALQALRTLISTGPMMEHACLCLLPAPNVPSVRDVVSSLMRPDGSD
ncbi:hypothetical protein F2Q70_00035175 [Brassica cretica]|uniref:Uncharacterized protein n=1 Tax=Brassica cretica TaxID=69181 RepID=A0A8S9JXV7_BRACR|nr:hypothetical protein F2Q70_00035175 [Brassica cretica]